MALKWFSLDYSMCASLLLLMTWFELKYDQDIMILPTGASRFEEALQMGSETYHHLKVVSFPTELIHLWDFAFSLLAIYLHFNF